MRPKPVKLSATTTEATYKLGPSLRSVMIRNDGGSQVYIDFDNPIDTDNSYLMEAGEVLTIEYNFINLHYQATGTATLSIIKIIQ
jgi:hypothetical protein